MGMNPRRQGFLGGHCTGQLSQPDILNGNTHSTVTLGNNTAASCKVKRKLPSDPPLTSSPVYSREPYTHIHAKLCVGVHSSITRDRPTPDAVQMLTSW